MLGAARERALVSEAATPLLPRHVRLHFDPVRQRHVAGEGVLAGRDQRGDLEAL